MLLFCVVVLFVVYDVIVFFTCCLNCVVLPLVCFVSCVICLCLMFCFCFCSLCCLRVLRVFCVLCFVFCVLCFVFCVV